MKTIITRIISILAISSFIFFQSCSDDETTAPPPLTVINISVKSANDSLAVIGANVVLYNADNGEAVSRIFSAGDGVAKFEAALSGNFYTRISANGFKELPEGNVSPVPFSVSAGQTFAQTYYMNIMLGTFGKIDGTVTPKLHGFLIVANSLVNDSEYHTYSGPDGYFLLFNIPYGAYVINAVRSGYQLNNQPEVTLSSSASYQTLQINVNQVNGSSLAGKVTFLAAVNGIVDISLLDQTSLSVISGLTTKIDSSRNYIISNIPNGSFIAWASYENDGYVMDPDWLFKNPSALNALFTADIAKTCDFSVTDAMMIVSPTNSADVILPAAADSVIPAFHWNAYPQAKEYIIEVRDINGSLIWGGFTESGVINHIQIPKEWNSVRFNFDGSAVSELNPGDIYQWKIYADDDSAPNIQTLLSSSEDLLGLFIIPKD